MRRVVSVSVSLLIVVLLLIGITFPSASADKARPQAQDVAANAAVNTIELVGSSLSVPPKPEVSSPWSKVSTALSQAADSVAALAVDGTLTGDPAALSSRLVRIDKSGNVEVDVWLFDASPDAVAAVEKAGLEIERTNLSANVVEGWLSYDALSAVAALDAVRQVTPPSYPDVDTGAVTSQGDAILRANLVRSNLGITGAGQKICALSDGVTHRAQAQSTGDLPATIDVRKAGSGDEGTAMLEIIHDLAPGASLGFYGPDTAVDMANGIRALRDAGCKVIVDDLSINGEPYFQDGQVSEAVTDVMVNSNVSYAGSAGNVADAHWQGGFTPGTVIPQVGTFERWAPGDEGFTLQVQPGGYFSAFLQWNDPFGGSANDYDLYLLDSTLSNVLDGSTDIQNGSGDPLEFLAYQNNGGSAVIVNLAVALYNGSQSSQLQLFTRGDGVARQYNVVAGSVTPNHHVVGMFTSGAIDAADPGHDTIESFSSQGPVVHYFGPVASASSIAAAETRKKPDISGIDGVSVTGAGGFPSPFFGTSAAAPHIAAIAGLVRSAKPAASQAQVYAAMTGTAVDLGTPGRDNTFGFGRADAYNAVLNIMGGAPTATPTRTPTSTPQPELGALPAVVPFLAGPGLPPPLPQTVSVLVTGPVPLNWTASKSEPWLDLAPISGTASFGSPGHITVTVHALSVSIGVHTTEITITSPLSGVVGSPKLVRVRLSRQSTLERLFLPVILSNH